MLDRLMTALADLETRCGAIMLSATGKAFCAGAKLTTAAIPAGPGHDAGALLEMAWHPLIRQVAALKVPLVVGVNGVAAGGGMALALSGDLIVASERASFVPAFASVGLVPDCGASRLLVRALGRARAARILMLNERFDAEFALRHGLVSAIVAPEQLDAEAMDFARRLAEGPRLALGLTRQLLWQAEELSLDEILQAEREAQRAAGLAPDHAAALARFLKG
jgi:2-(1,2-epoxy-1,2-dihydrophenyl)acetyl-CoA isomerase